MIPKIIHYCWFGGKEKDKLSKECIKTWHKHLKGYEFKEWNESNFDINSSEYVKQAYAAKKWAFVVDYVRFWVLKNYGGIYLDCDVKVYKDFTPLLDCEAFTSFEGAHSEKTPKLEAAIMGTVPNGKWISDMFTYFAEKRFVDRPNGDYDDIVIPRPIADMTIEKYGLVPNDTYQELDGLVVYPRKILSPLNGETKENFTCEESYSIHLFNWSYCPDNEVRTYQRFMNKYGRKKGKALMMICHPFMSLKLRKRPKEGKK